MVRVGLLGATGRVGGWVLEACLEKGYSITALVRSKDKLAAYSDKITIVEGDATTVEGLQALLKQEVEKPLNVIVSTLGSPSNSILIVEAAAKALVKVLEQDENKIPRIVWMTSTGINEATDQAKLYPLWGKASGWLFGHGGFGWLVFKVLIPYVIGQDLWDDMGLSETAIRGSPLVANTVIIRPTNMWPASEHATFSAAWRSEGGDNLEYVLLDAADPPPDKWMCRRAIAAALVDLMTNDSYDGTAKSLFQNDS
jgi:hypothetical protein